MKAAPDFEPWESAYEYDLLDIWEEDMAAIDGRDLDEETS